MSLTEHMTNLVIVSAALITLVYCSYGIWYLFARLRNYFFNLSKSLTLNDKTYIFEAGSDPNTDARN